MKNEIHYILLLIFLLVGCLNAQDRYNIVFNNKFLPENGTKVPYDKKVLLSGSYDSDIEKLKIVIYSDTETKEYDAVVNGKTWGVIVGPFAKGSNIFVEFHVIKTMSKDYIDRSIDKVSSLFPEVITKLLVDNSYFTEKSLRDSLKAKTIALIPDTIASIKTINNQTLPQLIFSNIDSVNPQILINGINAIVNAKRSQADIIKFADRLKKGNEKFASLWADFSKDLFSPKQLTQDALNDFFRSASRVVSDTASLTIMKENINLFIARWDSSISLADSLRTSLQDQKYTFSEISFASNISALTNLRVSELENYAGFDIGEYFVPTSKPIGTGAITMFSVNLYVHKVEFIDDPRDLIDKISLTAGIGVKSTYDNDGNIYFVGLGYRINKLFRAVGGVSLIKLTPGSSNPNYYAPLTLGFSINLRFMNELINLFN